MSVRSWIWLLILPVALVVAAALCFLRERRLVGLPHAAMDRWRKTPPLGKTIVCLLAVHLMPSFAMFCAPAVVEAVDDFPIREIIRHPTQEEMFADFLANGKRLMDLKGIPDGDETLVCTNWVCPTSIVVNATQYLVETNMWPHLGYATFKVMTTNMPSVKVANGNIEMSTDGKMARQMTFANCATTSLHLSDYAPRVIVRVLDPSTNAMAITYVKHPFDKCRLVYKNIRITTYSLTNALEIAMSLINEGLPEEERIPLPPAP